MTKIYPQNEFPLLEKYKEVFDVSDRTIFAYDHKIYFNGELPDHLIIHEQTHHKQQDEVGLDLWVEKYLTDVEFRLEQEVEAYRNQLQSVNRNFRRKLLKIVAKDLASPLYGNIVSFKEAVRLLK